MGIILTILGVVVIGYGVFGASQPAHNKPALFRSSGGTLTVFAVGIGLLVVGIVTL
jgi:hypothetical protein